jgi:hypothetical protein
VTKPPKSIIGSSAIMLPGVVTINQGPPHSYIGVAQQLVEGITVLAAAENPPAQALAMLAAQALECSLKAYLSRNGDDKRLNKKPLRLNINALWALASKDGLALSEVPDPWVSALSGLHDAPFDLRYATRFQMLVLPPAAVIAAGVIGLLERVRMQLVNPPTSE